jgi:peptidoglycan/xylan/chitin deacetylase (PgdA/CDA1 family)
MTLLARTLGPVLFPSILWRTGERSLHLTFDDGPHPDATPVVLEILREREIRATFFLVGTRVAQFPHLANEIAREGHSIGNHTLSHRNLFLKSRPRQTYEIVEADKIIAEAVGSRPAFFRPPYGYFDLKTLDIATWTDHQVVLWDVDSRDFENPSSASIAANVTKKARAGAILLFHDNHATAKKLRGLLDETLDRLEDRGYDFSPLPV